MKKHFKIAIQMDPLESINIKADSTYILALEAQKRGHRLFHYLPENLIYENGRVFALGNVFKLFPNKKTFFKKSKTQKIFLDDYDVVLVRQDPLARHARDGSGMDRHEVKEITGIPGAAG